MALNANREGIGRYIVQVARFDPAKGISTVIDAYAEFRRRAEKAGLAEIPQLVVYVTNLVHPIL